MIELIKPGTQFDFAGKRKIFLWISLFLFIGTIALFFGKGLNYGIDFTGGAEIEIRVPSEWDTGKVRAQLEENGLEGARVQQLGEGLTGNFLIKAQGDEASLNRVAGQVRSALAKDLAPEQFTLERVDVVGPAAGESLRTSGFLAMLYALIGILIYVTLRFDSRYAPGAIVALFHDAGAVIGIFILTGKQFDLQILAAILALIGYSINDTIVIFDRIRETLHFNPKMKVEEAVNRSLNETLGRTIITSLSTLLVVVCLWAFGGKVIEDFAFALMIGMLMGVYSTIFVASALMIESAHRQERKAAKAHLHGNKPSGNPPTKKSPGTAQRTSHLEA